jgi:hypothetical protein
MSAVQPALRQPRDQHIHVLSETCPLCDQPIPNEKAHEIRTRMEARERTLTEAANARAAEQIAVETARIEAVANAAVAQLRQENEEALTKANAESVTKVDAVRTEGRKEAETTLEKRIADAEKAKADTEAAAAKKIATAEEAARAHAVTWQAKIEAADTEKHNALVQVEAMKAGQEAVVSDRVREVREIDERDKADALAAMKAGHNAEVQKLSANLETLKRQIEKQRADELGEGAHIKLFDALKIEFPGDDIRGIPQGVSGADILHTVIHHGKACGAILYESKNSTAWRDDYVAKLIRDQTAARADHAILSTFKFPAGAAQVEVRDGVVIVNPARAIAIAQVVRKHLLLVHTLRLSKIERMQKMAALYDFITSERCALLLARIDAEAEVGLKLVAKDKRFHENLWRREGLLLRSIQKAKAELEIEVAAIIGSEDPVG